ncbi:ABC-F family ATP-binding cassette domain-containing protein [Candidatus Nomurabacteria bacterium]|nr:ABC-F family ATP-binding cassette domain-containing protein [Candidatus Nomurabacteria bacterium]
MSEEVVLRFSDVTFEYLERQPILDQVSFSVRRGAKITLMGQNGAGKSTLFNLIKGDLKPKSGNVFYQNDATIATAQQMIARADYDLEIADYFAKAFTEVVPGLKTKIAKVLEAVNLVVPMDRKVGDLSGGQQARLLLAFALIQNPDILLLDEPTNNLDQAGIDHLIQFLVMYEKTVIVISHDADFLNCFTEGVIYLDVHTKKIENYVGDYYSVVEEIAKRIEREIKKNAQLEKTIQDRKDKVNFFANKGGKMRQLARKLKEETQELEENKVDVRKEDKVIRDFEIPRQEIVGELLRIDSVKIIENHEPVIKKVEKILRHKDRMLVSGPNGIGKSTLLRALVENKSEGAKINPGLVVGYYSQNFSNLDFEQTVMESLESVRLEGYTVQDMRSMAAGFLLTGELMGRKVGDLSEGQKGLLAFARLVLMKPGLLILDEPTNHINFRHIPVIAKALNHYQGAIILISHMPDFVKEIEVNEYLDLGKL